VREGDGGVREGCERAATMCGRATGGGLRESGEWARAGSLCMVGLGAGKIGFTLSTRAAFRPL
jgi:hypothetical protein